MFDHVRDLASLETYYLVGGAFQFNLTDNESVLSDPIGSFGCYTSLPSKAGLWSRGKPNDISIGVQRIGYITIDDGSVSIYRDEPAGQLKATGQLSNYNDSFLHNHLVPASKLPQMDLFHPTP
jgi:hypothetical protein